MPKTDTQYNPVAEIPQEALTAAAEEWGGKSLDDMRQESTRLGLELKQINDAGDDLLKSPLLGGETASLEDNLQGLTKRIATKHYLTQRIGQAAGQERQLKAMVANMTAAENLVDDDPDIDPGLQHALDLDALGYERDRGVLHGRSADLFGTFLHHAEIGDLQAALSHAVHDSPLGAGATTGPDAADVSFPLAAEVSSRRAYHVCGHRRRARPGSSSRR